MSSSRIARSAVGGDGDGYAPNRKYGDGSAKENSLRALKASRAAARLAAASVERLRPKTSIRRLRTSSPAWNPSRGSIETPRWRARARSSTGAVATTRRHLDAALREDFDRLRSEYEDVLARATSGGGGEDLGEKLRSARLQEKSAQIAGVAFLR